MKGSNGRTSDLPMKVYERTYVPGTTSREEYPKLIVKFRVFLKDRPGSVAALSSLIGKSQGNISFFHYDRSVHCNRVVVEVQFGDCAELDSLLRALREEKYVFGETDIPQDELQITTLESVREIKARLVNEPGSLCLGRSPFWEKDFSGKGPQNTICLGLAGDPTLPLGKSWVQGWKRDGVCVREDPVL